MEDQGGAYETEADARRGDRDQHSGREARKDNERSAPRHTPHTRGHLRGVRAGQYLVLEDVLRPLLGLTASVPFIQPC